MAFFLIWLVFGFVYYYAENLNGTLCDDSTVSADIEASLSRLEPSLVVMMLVKVSFKTCNNFPTFPNGTARPNGTEEFDKYRVSHQLLSFYLFLRVDNHPQCVTGVYDFPSALLFSVETMTTIG